MDCSAPAPTETLPSCILILASFPYRSVAPFDASIELRYQAPKLPKKSCDPVLTNCCRRCDVQAVDFWILYNKPLMLVLSNFNKTACGVLVHTHKLRGGQRL